MSKYSWHTSKEKDDGGWYKCDAEIKLRTIAMSYKEWPYYRPCMKGGHTHNHVFNVVNRHTFRKKKQRLKAKNRKFLFDRSPKETLEDSLNHWAIFKELFYNKV